MISAALIVKNEEAVLRDCLESIKDHVSEIVIVDTGSTDDTVAIAKEYTDKVYTFLWIDDFAAARNFALDKTKGDWILSIDADETLITPPTIPAGNHKCANVTLTSKGHSHKYPRLLRKGTRWTGKIHEVPDATTNVDSGAVIEYGYSPAHKLDPDRNLRILEKAIETDNTPRYKYYLGNEYFERKDYDKAITTYHQYLKDAWWHPEIADAHLRLAYCCWWTQEGSYARKHCIEAIGYNPDFKEALLLMAEMTYEPISSKWRQIAERAQSTDVLFTRV